MNADNLIIEKLCSLRNHGSKFGIDRMRLLIDLFGSDYKKLPVIHIAGSNGKGSTAAIIEKLLHNAGLKTGLYTSPHLVHLGERIQVNRQALSDEQICKYAVEFFDKIKVLGEPGNEDYPSFFELMTLMALVHFNREHCDVAIIETGLGGRLDATNVLIPDVSVITSISLEHIEFLGDTLAKIAAEKAGIIKDGVPVVMSWVPEDAEKVIREIAEKHQSKLYSVREIYGDDLNTYPSINLEGAHQKRNAAAASIAVKIFLEKYKLDASVITSDIKNVLWPARWETKILKNGERLILDVSHNEECAESLQKLLCKNFTPASLKPYIIVSVLGELRARPLLKIISQFAEKIYLVRANQERACSNEELKTFLKDIYSGEVIESSISELFPEKNTCVIAEKERPVLVTGSCYLAGEVLGALEGNTDAGDSFLQDKILSERK